MSRPPRRFVRYARSRNGARNKEENLNENQYTEDTQRCPNSDQNSDENQNCLSIRTVSSESELQEQTDKIEKPVTRWIQENDTAEQVEQPQCLWRSQNLQVQQQKQHSQHYHSGNSQRHRGNRRTNNNNSNKYRNVNNNNNRNNNNSTFMRANQELLTTPEIQPQLLPTHKISGVLSDTAICMPSPPSQTPSFKDSKKLTETIGSLTDTLQQIVNKLKTNELIVAIDEVEEALKQTNLFCDQTAARGYVNKQQCLKELLSNSMAVDGKGWRKYSESEQPENYAQQLSLRKGSDCGCAMHDCSLRLPKIQESRLTSARMISRSTTMHNDILQISNICLGYRLTLPVQLMHCLFMIFICLSFCMEKNSQIIVYILTIALVIVAVHVLSRNVYYYVNANPAGINVTNDATL